MSSRPTVSSFVVDTAGSAGVVADTGASVLVGKPVLGVTTGCSVVVGASGVASGDDVGASVVVGAFL